MRSAPRSAPVQSDPPAQKQVHNTVHNVEVVQAVIDAFRSGDLQELLSHAHPDLELRLSEHIPYGGNHSGHEEFIRTNAEVLEGWDKLEIRVDKLSAVSREHVVLEGAFVGNRNPGDEPEAIPVAVFFTVRDGLVVRVAQYTDSQALAGR